MRLIPHMRRRSMRASEVGSGGPYSRWRVRTAVRYSLKEWGLWVEARKVVKSMSVSSVAGMGESLVLSRLYMRVK